MTALPLSERLVTFSEDDAMIAESAAAFCRERWPVAAVRAELMSAPDASADGFTSALWQDVVALGWTTLGIPEVHGGSGLGFSAAVSLVEAMGRQLAAWPIPASLLAAQALQVPGVTPALAADWLPRIAAGARVALAILDDADWGGAMVACQATPASDHWVLSGDKPYVLDAEGADLLLVLAGCEDGTPVVACVDRADGTAFTAAPHTLIDETRRAASLTLNGVAVPASHVITGDAAIEMRRSLLVGGALLAAADATGAAQAALNLTVQYLVNRTQFGRPIGSYQALKHPTVDALNAIESARSLVYHAATLWSREGLSATTEVACRMAKVQSAEALLFIGDRSVQFHGGMGFTYDCDAQLYLRRALFLHGHFGDPAHHRRRLGAMLALLTGATTCND
ncbi:MAG: acyl-CoA dehydrogenase family protein [Pseudomonadota bacterium]